MSQMISGQTMLPVAILAGGLATRLRPVTEHLPKSLLPVAGEPFLAHQLRRLRAEGIQYAVLCAGHLGEKIQEYAGDGSAFGLRLEYSFDGDVLRGTAGALAKALPLLGDAFFVLYGDSYLPCDYGAVQKAFLDSGKDALMTVFPNLDRWDSSNVEYAEGQIRIYDKLRRTPSMQHIDYGLGVFRKAAFAHVLPDQPYDLATLYQTLLAQNRLAAYEVRERFYEIGSWAGLQEIEAYLAGQNG
jgi:NDP-sugar pyrophosphorylase family protein